MISINTVSSRTGVSRISPFKRLLSTSWYGPDSINAQLALTGLVVAQDPEAPRAEPRHHVVPGREVAGEGRGLDSSTTGPSAGPGFEPVPRVSSIRESVEFTESRFHHVSVSRAQF